MNFEDLHGIVVDVTGCDEAVDLSQLKQFFISANEAENYDCLQDQENNRSPDCIIATALDLDTMKPHYGSVSLGDVKAFLTSGKQWTDCGTDIVVSASQLRVTPLTGKAGTFAFADGDGTYFPLGECKGRVSSIIFPEAFEYKPVISIIKKGVILRSYMFEEHNGYFLSVDTTFWNGVYYDLGHDVAKGISDSIERPDCIHQHNPCYVAEMLRRHYGFPDSIRPVGIRFPGYSSRSFSFQFKTKFQGIQKMHVIMDGLIYDASYGMCDFDILSDIAKIPLVSIIPPVLPVFFAKETQAYDENENWAMTGKIFPSNRNIGEMEMMMIWMSDCYKGKRFMKWSEIWSRVMKCGLSMSMMALKRSIFSAGWIIDGKKVWKSCRPLVYPFLSNIDRGIREYNLAIIQRRGVIKKMKDFMDYEPQKHDEGVLFPDIWRIMYEEIIFSPVYMAKDDEDQEIFRHKWMMEHEEQFQLGHWENIFLTEELSYLFGLEEMMPRTISYQYREHLSWNIAHSDELMSWMMIGGPYSVSSFLKKIPEWRRFWETLKKATPEKKRDGPDPKWIPPMEVVNTAGNGYFRDSDLDTDWVFPDPNDVVM